MKRIRFFAAVLLCMFLVNIIPVSASDEVNLPKVVDNADILTDAEETELTGLIDGIVTQYQIDVILVTENQRQEASAQAEADMLFDSNGYGVGEKKDGVLFLVDMNAGEWAISTHGDAIALFTDYDLNMLGQNAAQGYFSNGQFGVGFRSYLEELSQKLEEKLNPPVNGQSAGEESADANAGAENSGADTENPAGNDQSSNDKSTNDKSSNDQSSKKPVHVKTELTEKTKSPADFIIAALVCGLIITLIYMKVMRSGMKTAYKQKNADTYKRKDASTKIRKKDVFLSSSVTKIPIKQDSKSQPDKYEKSGNQKSTKSSSFWTTDDTEKNGEKHGGASGSFRQDIHTSQNGEKHGGASGKF